MKTINFTAKEVLPGLLDRTKKQTIRKAWTECPNCNGFKLVPLNRHIDTVDEDGSCKCCNKNGNVDKPPKHKVGDEVQLVWKSDDKGSIIYCCECGKQINSLYEDHSFSCGEEYETFEKNLGTAVITKVFKIEMFKRDKAHYILQNKINFDKGDNNKLAKRDGFKSAEDFFEYFDKNYDLSSPKKFYVYRWKFISKTRGSSKQNGKR